MSSVDMECLLNSYLTVERPSCQPDGGHLQTDGDTQSLHYLYHPQMDELVEQFNRTLTDTLAKTVEEIGIDI